MLYYYFSHNVTLIINEILTLRKCYLGGDWKVENYCVHMPHKQLLYLNSELSDHNKVENINYNIII